MGVTLIVSSFQIYLRMKKDKVSKPLAFVAPYAVAVLLLLTGIFSLTVAGLIAYMKVGGG